jgi:hypothetical protein
MRKKVEVIGGKWQEGNLTSLTRGTETLRKGIKTPGRASGVRIPAGGTNVAIRKPI